MLGKWCAYDDGLGSGSMDYKRCTDDKGQDLVVGPRKYVTDTLCVITGSITMAPDKTYFITADCKAEGNNRTCHTRQSRLT
jgi:hypothetical protein